MVAFVFHLTLKKSATNFCRLKKIGLLKVDCGSELVETFDTDSSSVIFEGVKIKIGNDISEILKARCLLGSLKEWLMKFK